MKAPCGLAATLTTCSKNRYNGPTAARGMVGQYWTQLCPQQHNFQTSLELAHVHNTSFLSFSLVMALGRECQLQRGAMTLLGSAVSLRSRPGGSKGSVLTHMALPSSRRHLPEVLSCLNTQSLSSSLQELNNHDPVSRTSPARFVHAGLLEHLCSSPQPHILSDSFVSSPTPTPQHPLASSPRPAWNSFNLELSTGFLSSPFSLRLCLGSRCLSDDHEGKRRAPASLEIAQRLQN